MKIIDFNKDISLLNFNNIILKKFRDNDILTIKKLWVLKRKDLKKIGFKDAEINNIIIKLQLYGIDINKKIYNRD